MQFRAPGYPSYPGLPVVPRATPLSNTSNGQQGRSIITSVTALPVWLVMESPELPVPPSQNPPTSSILFSPAYVGQAARKSRIPIKVARNLA